MSNQSPSNSNSSVRNWHNKINSSRTIKELSSRPKISILVPVFNPKKQYLEELLDSILGQIYTEWELCIVDDASTEAYVQKVIQAYAQKDNRIKPKFLTKNAHVSVTSNEALSLATGLFVALVDHDDTLDSYALQVVAEFLEEHPKADIIYSDEAHFNDDGYVLSPFLKPDWCPDSFLASMYTCHLSVYRRSLINDVGGFRIGYEGSQDYDLMLRATELTDKIFHIPEILYYWRVHPGSVTSGSAAKPYAYEAGRKAIEDALLRRQESAVVLHVENLPGNYIVRYQIRGLKSVSVIIFGANVSAFLEDCVASLRKQLDLDNLEIIVVDSEYDSENLNKRDHEKSCIYLKSENSETTVELLNKAVSISSGKYLLFLDSRLRFQGSDALLMLVEQAQRDSIGAVGTLVLRPDGSLYNSGYVLGGPAIVATQTLSYPSIRNYSAVSGECLLSSRDAFDKVGGISETYDFQYWDIDFCLKLRAMGYHNVLLPHVKSYRIDELSYTQELFNKSLEKRFQDADKLIETWKIDSCSDPCCSSYLAHPYDLTQLTVIVPWWDHTELLEIWEKNLGHLLGAEIIFIDNGSKLEGQENLAKFCARYKISLIRNDKNRGFSAANNQALAIASREYILHLNNDIQIINIPFDHLLNLADQGVVGPGPATNELNINYVEGWGLCAKRDVLKEIGNWCEDYGPGYWDDVDLCYRAELKGYSLLPVPQFRQWAHHMTNKTGRDGRINQINLHIRNRGLFVRKYFNTTPKIIVDGVFFQLYQTGIARVWRSLLEVWAGEELSNHLVVLDRANTTPKIPGIRYRKANLFSYENTESDRAMLQQICDEEGADLFISTYYTTPLTTSSVFMAYDMIPEVVGANLNEPMWREKHHAIHHASGYIAISHNTAQDLANFFPDIALENIIVAHCGVSSDFQVAAISEISSFRQKYGITKPYYIVSGGGRGYKNSLLFFQAFASLASRQGFEIVCTGSGGFLEDGFRQYTAGITVHMLHLSDEELRLAYAGAIALVYPSKYEGFGLPVLEAMACGCPVITCRNASLPEVGGDAVIYVDDSNPADLADALCEIQKPSVRNALIAAGIERSQQFSWASMAQTMQDALLKITLERFNLRRLNWIVFPDWSAPEEVLGTALQNLLIQVNEHPSCLEMTILISAINVVDPEEADLLLSSVALNLAMEQGIDISEGPEIALLSDISPLQWKALQTDLQGRITLASEDLETIQKLEAQNLTAFTLEELLEIG